MYRLSGSYAVHRCLLSMLYTKNLSLIGCLSTVICTNEVPCGCFASYPILVPTLIFMADQPSSAEKKLKKKGRGIKKLFAIYSSHPNHRQPTTRPASRLWFLSPLHLVLTILSQGAMQEVQSQRFQVIIVSILVLSTTTWPLQMTMLP